MKTKDKIEIEEISKEFAKGLGIELKGSGWLIVDPLSSFLTVCGFPNTLSEIPAKDNQQQVLIMTFKDGTQFIPAGSDLPQSGAKDWLWLDKIK